MAGEVYHPNVPGVVVGRVKGRVFTVKKKAKHFMRKFQGFCISEAVLDQLEALGATRVVIAYTCKNKKVEKYWAPVSVFRSSSLKHSQPAGAGFDHQRCLRKAAMQTV